MLFVYKSNDNGGVDGYAYFFFDEKESIALSNIRHFLCKDDDELFNNYLYELIASYADYYLDLDNFTLMSILGDLDKYGKHTINTVLLDVLDYSYDDVNIDDVIKRVISASYEDSVEMLKNKRYNCVFVDIIVKMGMDDLESIDVINETKIEWVINTNMKEGYYHLKNLHYDNIWLHSSIFKKYKKIYYTRNFDHIVEVCNCLKSKDLRGGELYYLDGYYYLVLNISETLSYKVCEFLNESNRTYAYIKDYGKKISDDLKGMLSYFKQG